MANTKQEPFCGDRPDHFVREWRQFRKMTTRALGKASGMSHVAVGRIERREAMLNEETLARLAEALNTDPISLMVTNPLEGPGIWDIWRNMTPEERKQLVAVARALKRT